jgi:molecular chaperone GrpE (heat shock protein)
MESKLDALGEALGKMDKQQKEISLQLEEIDVFLQDGGDESALVAAIMAIFDVIYDFYYFAVQSADPPLAAQAAIMHDSALTSLGKVGVSVITPSGVAFDFNQHTAVETAQNEDIPFGYVLKTLKCGYVRDSKILRRAAVVVNKKEQGGMGQ